MKFLAWCFIATLAACIPRPDDPVAVGELCVPATSDCSSNVILIRDSVGRNQLDFSVTSTSDSTVDVTAFVINPTVIDFDPSSFESRDVITRKDFRAVEPGATVSERFTPRVLGTREDLRLVMSCEACEISVDYVFQTVPLECFEDQDCTSNWLCDDQFGHCAECISNDDCNDDQTCDSVRGRCTPEDTQPSCSTIASAPSLWILLLFVFARRRRKRTIVVGLSVFLFSATLWASPPSAGMSVGTGIRFLTGELGQNAKRGIGFVLSQELRWRYVGGAVSLGTSFYQTTQTPPPFTRGVQLYNAAIGPRVYLPLGDFDAHLGADVSRVGLLGNSLVRITGTQNNFSSVGVVGGARFNWDRIVFKFETGFSPFFNLPGSVLRFDLSVGFGSPR